MKIYIKILFVFFTYFTLVFSQSLQNKNIQFLNGEFTRVFKVSASSDSIHGKFFYFASNKIYFDIDYPLHQIMFIENKNTNIFYPESEKAFLFESTNPVALPLITGILAAIRPDNGLSVLGFKLNNQEMNNDTLVTFWIHSNEPDKFGTFKIGQYEDRLVYSNFHAQDSSQHTETLFKNHSMIQNDILVPLQINTKIFSQYGVAIEKIKLNNLNCSHDIPNKIKNFKIPDHIQVIKRKW